MVAGLRRAASTSRSRNSPSDQREPVPFQAGREVALEALLGEWAGVAKQAGALALDHDGAAALRVARRAGQRLRDGVADDLVRTQRLLRRAPARRMPQRRERRRRRASSEHLAGDGAVPGVGIIGLGLARPARRVLRADDGAAFGLGVLVVDRAVGALLRDGVVRRDQAVAGRGQRRRERASCRPAAPRWRRRKSAPANARPRPSAASRRRWRRRR